MPLLEDYINAIKGFEGFTPRAKWDYKQYSGGYGTRAQPGQTFTQEQADAALRSELDKAQGYVGGIGAKLSPGWDAALTSLTFNAGPGWINSGLGDAVRAGDWDTAKQRFAQYNRAGGQFNQGLANRRAAELGWLDNAPSGSLPPPMALGGPKPEDTPMGILSKPKPDPQEELYGLLGQMTPTQSLGDAMIQMGAGLAGNATRGWGAGIGAGLAGAGDALGNAQTQRMRLLGLMAEMQQQQQAAAANAPFKAAELANMQSLMRSRDADAAMQQQLNKLLFGGGVPGAAAPSSPLQSQSYNPQMPTQQGLQQIGNPMSPGFQLTADESGASIDAQAQAGAAQEPSGPSGYDPGAVYSMPGNEIVNTPIGQMSRDQARRLGAAFAAGGKGDLGKMMMEAASGGPDRAGKAGANKIDLKQIDAINHVSRLNEVGALMKPEYLEIPTRLGMWGKGALAKFGALPEKDKAGLKAYAEGRRAAVNNMSRLLNELSGAAVSPQEYQRIIKTQPDAGIGLFDGDDPVSFQGKLEGARKEQLRAIARYNYLRARGFTGKPWEAMPLEAVDGAIDKRGAEIEQDLRQQNPNVDPMALREAVKGRIKQEFGI